MSDDPTPLAIALGKLTVLAEGTMTELRMTNSKLDGLVKDVEFLKSAERTLATNQEQMKRDLTRVDEKSSTAMRMVEEATHGQNVFEQALVKRFDESTSHTRAHLEKQDKTLERQDKTLEKQDETLGLILTTTNDVREEQIARLAREGEAEKQRKLRIEEEGRASIAKHEELEQQKSASERVARRKRDKLALIIFLAGTAIALLQYTTSYYGARHGAAATTPSSAHP